MWTQEQYYNKVKSRTGFYIYLLKEDYNTHKADIAAAFSTAAQEGQEGLASRALKQQTDYLKTVEQYGNEGIDMISIIEELGENGTLEEILSKGAEYIEQLVNSASGGDLSEFGSIRQQGYESLFGGIDKNSGYSSSGLSASSINSFFDAAASAQQIINSSSVGAIELLRTISLNRGQGVTTWDIAQIEQAGNAARYLLGAIENGGFFYGNKDVNIASVIGTLHNVYGKAFGEEIVYDALINIPEDAQIDTIIEDGLLSVSGQNVKAKLSGTDTTENNHTFKSDVLVNGLMSYSATKAGEGNYNLSLDSNISVKWASGVDKTKNNQGSIHIISNTPLLRWVNNSNLNLGSDNLGYVGNVIIHEGSSSKNNQALRNCLAANFAEEWLAGEGSDTAQYLMVNGKFYSMLDVINSAFKAGEKKSAISVSLSGIDKVAEANSIGNQTPNRWVNDAVARHNRIESALSNVVLGATFNMNFLTV